MDDTLDVLGLDLEEDGKGFTEGWPVEVVVEGRV